MDVYSSVFFSFEKMSLGLLESKSPLSRHVLRGSSLLSMGFPQMLSKVYEQRFSIFFLTLATFADPKL